MEAECDLMKEIFPAWGDFRLLIKLRAHKIKINNELHFYKMLK
jgi:hypothetical protein